MSEVPVQSEMRDLRYDPQPIERKWAERWAAQPELYRAEPAGSARKKTTHSIVVHAVASGSVPSVANAAAAAATRAAIADGVIAAPGGTPPS